MKSLLLLSGGLDSAVCGGLLKRTNHDVTCLTFRYGQNHAIEVEFAERVARWLGATEHIIFDLSDFGRYSKSSLTSDPSTIPKGCLSEGVAPTFVPARNLVFLSIACGIAESRDIQSVCTGVNAVDYSGYPDCRPEFVEALRHTVEHGLTKRVLISTPLINWSKSQILAKSRELSVPPTLSCYDPQEGGKPCGLCDSCLIRQNAETLCTE